ncbi:hypothetical protein [Saccharibacter floricola]|uniref:hypothetical protein n=1 Tax=Saccharibacter floricola TaxID=231053 RepID=UPI00037E45DF|nr:hypothetical protein [Saccharibacter floricola]
MTVGFALALVLVLITLGRDGRWLPLYGVLCALTAASSGSGIMAVLVVLALLLFNSGAWIGLRGFSAARTSTHVRSAEAILPVVATLLMQFVLALSGADLGLVLTLGVGLVVAGLCSAACGAPLAQFCGLLKTADGVLMVACLLGSWGLFVTGIALWSVMAVLGVTLLPRLAWRKVEE